MTFWKERFEQFGTPELEPQAIQDDGVHGVPFREMRSCEDVIASALLQKKLSEHEHELFAQLIPQLADISSTESTAMAGRLCSAIGTSPAGVWGMAATMVAMRAKSKSWNADVLNLQKELGLSDEQLRQLYITIQIPLVVAEAMASPKRPESFSPNTYPFEYDESEV